MIESNSQPYTIVPNGRGRYVICDPNTRQILDDAQGFGYRTQLNAEKAAWYKFKGGKEAIEATKAAAETFWYDHPDFAAAVSAFRETHLRQIAAGELDLPRALADLARTMNVDGFKTQYLNYLPSPVRNMSAPSPAHGSPYAGVSFPNRLSASWAAYLDQRRIKWEFLPHGPAHLSTSGTPAFYLPSKQHYLAVLPHPGPALMPTIYLAGKMSNGHDYRSLFSRASRAYSVNGVDVSIQTFPVSSLVVGPYLLGYAGPYSSSCDHGCAHSGQHLFADCANSNPDDGIALVRRCEEAVRRCDIFFAHFETADQFGTLVELGWAKALGKPIWMTMTLDLYGAIDYSVPCGHGGDEWACNLFGDHDLWFAEFCAAKYAVTDDPMGQLQLWLSDLTLFVPGRASHVLACDEGADHRACTAFGAPDECLFYPFTPDWYSYEGAYDRAA